MTEPSTAMATVFSERRSDLVVTARESAAADVVAFKLADPSGAALPEWTPGAHIDVLLDDGLVRQYSLCGSPADHASWRIGVLLEPESRGGSRRMHELQVGDPVAVRGPRNHFPLLGAARHVFIAGGIGITPILPMVRAAEAATSDWRLWYGGRSRSSMAFLDELAGPVADRVTVCPQDETGMLPLAEILGEPGDDVLVYCCGPEGLLSAVEAICASWPSGSLRLERFSAKPQEVPAGGDASFEVVCQRSGVTIVVPPDKSIIDALEDNGVSVLSSCLEGVCGTCETQVIEGVPEHRDSLLSDDEKEANEYMMICVGRARSERLVLDL